MRTNLKKLNKNDHNHDIHKEQSGNTKKAKTERLREANIWYLTVFLISHTSLTRMNKKINV